MSLAQKIAPQLPYLRRFARALCGSQPGGDAYVAATLETIIADPEEFEEEGDTRIALYRTFLRLWNSLPVNDDPRGAVEAAGGAERNLAALTPRPRQAFLLRAVEGFSEAEAASILSMGEAELESLLDEANREIAAQVATEVLIIEDEPVIAMDLEGLVRDLGHGVVGVARTRTEAGEIAARRRPGLVLADIHLADGSSGLDAVNDMLAEFQVPVIFITAYPERLLTGSKPEPAFLITKPFQPDSVKAAISQALFFDRRATRS